MEDNEELVGGNDESGGLGVRGGVAAAATTNDANTDNAASDIDIDYDYDSSSLITRIMSSMARRPAFFLAFLPTLWVVLIAVGWTREDIVEDRVIRIWSQYRSDFRMDQEYANSLGSNDLGSTAFFAMARSRDNGNIFTPQRLDQLVQRMKLTEATTIQYKQHTISWADICSISSIGPNTSYKFPCARISPIDFFQEARWFFREIDRVTWYQEIVRKIILKPRMERFGIVQNACSDIVDPAVPRNDCNHIFQLRNDPDYAVEQGFTPAYANPIGLFGDIGSIEMSDPCKICIETEFENTIDQLELSVRRMFQILQVELERAIQQTTTNDSQLQQQLANIILIRQSLTRQSVIDYSVYTTIRRLYASLGAASVSQAYADFASPALIFLCAGQLGIANCPNAITEQEAQALLIQHADHAFSSHNTGGLPLPFWGDETPDRPAVLFEGTNPVSGSGLDLSGEPFSTMAFLDAESYNPDGFGDTWTPNYGTNTVLDLDSDQWKEYVETDPVYKWFLAGVTLASNTYCGNEDILGTQIPLTDLGAASINEQTADAIRSISPKWCTKHNIPSSLSLAPETETATATYSVQHFARMWYDLVIDSPSLLRITQGSSDPYVWTIGEGCGYSLGGERAVFTDVADNSILMQNASGQLYYIDEGSTLGPIDRHILMGGTEPGIDDYSPDNPLQSVKVINTIYPAALPKNIAQRVANCNRPGGPIDISESEAWEILLHYKEAFEESWTAGWDDDSSGDVQFVGFFDDQGVIGTTGRLLKEITLDNGTLVAISILMLAVFSALFLFDCDPVESRVLVTTAGVGLVILTFFAAVGFGILCGIKVNLAIGWTLPFIILGLGVDDMYMVVLAIKKQSGYTKQNFTAAMKDIFVPVTMTSTVNAAMFATLNISDVPAIYLTARVALISVVFLYLTIIFCFPAYCWLDMKRQEANRRDITFCKQSPVDQETGTTSTFDHFRLENPHEEAGQAQRRTAVTEDFEEIRLAKIAEAENEKAGGANRKRSRPGHMWASFMYDSVYKPLLLGEKASTRIVAHSLMWVTAATLIGLAIWGISKRTIGLGLEGFFPFGHQAKQWATVRTAELASWSVAINWGALNYSNPEVQMKMVLQYENVVASPHVAESDTSQLWMADLQIWASRLCTDNFDRDAPLKKECGMDQIYPNDNSTCSATWMLNTIGRRIKNFSNQDQCIPFSGGICRPTEWMHPADLEDIVAATTQGDGDERSWCPVLDNWDDAKMQFCVGRWRDLTGGGGRLVLMNETGTPREECTGEYRNDELVRTPIPFSQGPNLFVFGLTSHEETLDMIDETRSICDNDDELHCWMTGVPYEFWSQYIGIFDVLVQLGSSAVVIGFIVAFTFLFLELKFEGNHPTSKIVIGSIVSALLIAMVTLMSLVTVTGLSFLAGVSLTGFSNMAFVLSVGFAVEFAVHVISRWLRSDLSIEGGVARVEYTMSFLMIPTFMSFVSGVIGVSCLAFTSFEFNEVYFFRPLMIVLMVTYFYGCWWLPCLLTLLDFDFLRLGKQNATL